MDPRELRIEDYTYELPEGRIAKYPLADRDSSRLLVYDDGVIAEDVYSNISQHIPAGSLMVFNQAKVVNARLLFRKESGGAIEVFCLAPHEQYADVQTAMQARGSVLWECLVGGASKWKQGLVLTIVDAVSGITLAASIEERRQGSYILRLAWADTAITFAEVLHHIGKVPLPPYLQRQAEVADTDSYQTIFARDEGSVAAPTAGLHFTDSVLARIAQKGINKAFVTLHVGAGTFIPVKSETMDGHAMHAEWIEVSIETVLLLADTIAASMGIVPVGTTSLRTIESLYWLGNKLVNGQTPDLHGLAVSQWDPYSGAPQHNTVVCLRAVADYMTANDMRKLVTRTQILIAPGYQFKLVSGLVTNFHQPESTLLLLVAALIGADWRAVYNHALDSGFRFLSYGDGCLLWRRKE